MPWKITHTEITEVSGYVTFFFFPFTFSFHRTFTTKVEPPGQVELVNKSFEVTFISFNGEHFRAVLLNDLEEAFQMF